MPDRLPNADKAQIDPRKLRDYAPNPAHYSGRYKAAFFAQMGYTAENWQLLEHDIREQILTQSAQPGQPSPYGHKYTITARLQGPQGTARRVTTAWIFRLDHDFAELVTIEPATRRKAD